MAMDRNLHYNISCKLFMKSDRKILFIFINIYLFHSELAVLPSLASNLRTSVLQVLEL